MKIVILIVIILISGLDPALFNIHGGAGTRLSSGDGKYVQILHTNAGIAAFNFSLGDIDFWANNGQTQSGCSPFDNLCSHIRAIDYYAESLNSKVGFIGRKCDNYNDFTRGGCANNPTAVMGGVIPRTNLTGNFYFTTNSNSPYARGVKGD